MTTECRNKFEVGEFASPETADRQRARTSDYNTAEAKHHPGGAWLELLAERQLQVLARLIGLRADARAMIGHAASSMSARSLPSIRTGLRDPAYVVVVAWQILGVLEISTLSQGLRNMFSAW